MARSARDAAAVRQLLEDYIPAIARAVFDKVNLEADGHVLTDRGLHVKYNKAKATGYVEKSSTGVGRWGLLSRVTCKPSSKLDAALRANANIGDEDRTTMAAASVLRAFGKSGNKKRGQNNLADRMNRITQDVDVDPDRVMNMLNGRGTGGNAEEMDMMNTATVGASLM